MDFKKDLMWPLGVAGVIGGITVILCFLGDAGKWNTILFTTVFTLISFVMTSWLMIFLSFRKELERRLSKLARFSALHTDNHSFEDTLGILQQYSGMSHGIQWLVAKFISYKLNKNFKDCSNAKIVIENIDGREYSKLLERLIDECEEEILMTCPYDSSKNWFRTLNISECSKCSGLSSPCKIKNIKKRAPAHIVSLIDNKKPKTRIRLVTKEWKTRTSKTDQGEKCRKHFLTLSKAAHLKNYLVLGDAQLKARDINILDGVLVEWNRRKHECILMIGTDEASSLHEKFFEQEILENFPYA